MDRSATDAVDSRRKFVEAWNKTMLDIWQEQIVKLDVIDTTKLYHSPGIIRFIPDDDGKFHSFEIDFGFLEYGLWQDLGTGYGYALGNGGDLPFLDENYRKEHRLDKPRKRGPKWGGGYTSGNPRERRRWFSTKYYSSVMNLRDFMAESLGDEFKSMFARLDADDWRTHTDYYRRKGYTR